MCFTKHVEHLQKLCRVCGGWLWTGPKSGYGYNCSERDKKSLTLWSDLLEGCFSIMIHDDIPEMHPTKFCHSCRQVLARWCEAQMNNRNYQPATVLYEWEEHSENSCSLCQRFSGLSQGRRIKKCKRRYPRRAPKPKPTNKSAEDEDNHYLSDHFTTSCSMEYSDHSYAYVPPPVQFARKRKAESSLARSEKRRVMDLDLLKRRTEFKDSELCSMYSTKLCMATPLHENFVCSVCFGIVDNPLITSCNHTGCKTCMEKWTASFASCPECQEVLRWRDLRECDSLFKGLVQDLPMKCHNQNCREELTVKTFQEHISICTVEFESTCTSSADTSIQIFSSEELHAGSSSPLMCSPIRTSTPRSTDMSSPTLSSETSTNSTSSLMFSPVRTSTPRSHASTSMSSPTPSSETSTDSTSTASPSISMSTPTCRRGRPPKAVTEMCQNSQNARLRTLKEAIKCHADKYEEDLHNIYYTLLINHLRSSKYFKKADAINNVFNNQEDLDATACLAIRINTFQSITKYRKMQSLAKDAGKDIFQSYFAIREAEKKFVPGSSDVRYRIVPRMEHPPSGGTSIDSMGYVPDNFPELGVPHVKSERYYYDEALATSIKDLELLISEGLKAAGEDPDKCNKTMTIFIKDGGDGMGEVKRKNYKSEEQLADKALRYSFSITEIRLDDDANTPIYVEEKPNSQLNCRPLLIALADENDYNAFTSMTVPLLEEREHLAKAEMHFMHGSATWNFKMVFRATMYDEKLERKAVGLAGCSSDYLCTMCESSRHEAFTHPFQYGITRSSNRNEELIDERVFNDNKDTYRNLTRNSKGVKADSFIENTPHLDTLHCEINSASWLKKIYVREIAGVKEWAKKNHQEKLTEAEAKLDTKLRQEVGLQRRLMQPGNYSRLLLSEECTRIVLSLIKAERRAVVEQLIEQYRTLKRVWKATWPLKSCPDEVRNYPQNALLFVTTLKTHFAYIENHMPNYVHKLLAHVPELIERYGSVGAYSSEANEHGNKLFRLLRKMCARQNTKYELSDILKFHWLYTMRSLQEKAKVVENAQRCSKCFKLGHKVTTCVLRESEN